MSNSEKMHNPGYLMLKVRSGSERKTASIIEENLKLNVLVPLRREKILYLGYVFIQYDTEGDVERLRHDLKTIGIKGYVVSSGINTKSRKGTHDQKPYFLTERDVERLNDTSEESKTHRINLGDSIRVTDGLLKDCEGKVYSIESTDPLVLKVAVNLGQTEIFTTLREEQIINLSSHD